MLGAHEIKQNKIYIFTYHIKVQNFFCEVPICWEHGVMKRKILICIP